MGRLIVNIHDSAYCEGRGSWVHTSQWLLNTAPVYWDEQRRQAFRSCEHVTMLRDLDDWELDDPLLGAVGGDAPRGAAQRMAAAAAVRDHAVLRTVAGSPAATTTSRVRS